MDGSSPCCPLDGIVITGDGQEESEEGDDADKDPAANKGHKLATVAKFLNGALPSQVGRTQSDNDRVASVGTSTTRTWGVSSLFGSRGSSVGNSSKRHAAEVVHDIDQAPPVIQLKNPPSILRPGETETEYQVEIVVTKILITSYYDIVRRNIQDLVPKAIMHYLVNHAKRHLLGTFIEKLYRENLFEDLLQEHDEVVTKRRRTLEMCHALQQAVETLDEFVADISTQRSSESMNASPKSSSSDFYSNSRS